MVTTIKLHEDTKAALDTLKDERESYDTVIRRLAQGQRRARLRERLIEEYEAVAAEQMEEFAEWDAFEL